MTSLTETAREMIRTDPALAAEIARQMAPIRAVGLTSRQRDLFDFIRSYSTEHGVSPSYDEMWDAIGLASKSRVHDLVVALEERGFIRRLPNRVRSIAILEVPA